MRKLLYIIMLLIAFVSCDLEPTDKEIELEESLVELEDSLYELNSQLEEARDSVSIYKEVIDNIKNQVEMTFYNNEYTLDEFLEYMEEEYYFEL